MTSGYCVGQCSFIYFCIVWKKTCLFNNKNAYLYYGLGHAVMTNCPKTNLWFNKCLFLPHIAHVHHELAGGLCSMSCHPRTQADEAYTWASLVTMARGKRDTGSHGSNIKAFSRKELTHIPFWISLAKASLMATRSPRGRGNTNRACVQREENLHTYSPISTTFA